MGALGSDPKSSTAALGPLHCEISIGPYLRVGVKFCRATGLDKQQLSYRLSLRCYGASGDEIASIR